MMSSEALRPHITVLMACYNAEKWLHSSVSSVLNQTYKDFEFIIVDDGSVDNTLEVIQGFAAIDSRIVFISKPNSGPGDARNAGIQIARGEWIAVIDADDIFEPMKLEKQVQATKKNANLVFIGTGLIIIDESGRRLKTYNYPESHIVLKRNLRTARKFPPHSSVMYKTSAVQKLGGYHGRVSQAEDADLWLRLSEVGELNCLKGTYVQIRKHPGQISHFENGMRQMLDARIATVASWVRHFGYADPTAANDEYFNNYRFWVNVRLNENGLFQFLSYKEKLHSKIDMALKSKLGFLDLIKLTLNNPKNTIRYIKEKCFGESLPKRLAIRWINEKNNLDK